MSSATQAHALRDFHVVVAKRHVLATEGLKLASYATLVKRGSTLTVLVYLIQPSIHWAEVIYHGNVTIVDFQIYHQGYLIPPSLIVLELKVISPVVLPQLHPPPATRAHH